MDILMKVVVSVAIISSLISCTKATNCRHNLNGVSGYVTTPGYPFDYPAHSQCSWTIRAPPGRHVAMIFLNFILEQSDRCQYDSVQIFDGEGTETPITAHLCGATIPAPVISTGNVLSIRFRSDDVLSYSGFRARYRVVDELSDLQIEPETDDFEDPIFETVEDAVGSDLSEDGSSSSGQCGREYVNVSRAVITSPNYPNNYFPNKECTWVIRAPEGHTVSLTFVDFHLESDDSGQCRFDWVKVFNDGSDDPIATFCGESSAPVTSSGEVLTVRFKSDDSISATGFRAVFTVTNPASDNGADWLQSMQGDDPGQPIIGTGPIEETEKSTTAGSCGQDLHDSSGVINSPNYPDGYPNFANCRWIIHAPEGYVVVLVFTDFDLEQSDRCRHDWVRVYNVVEGASVSTFCGSEPISEPLISSGNVMTVVFGSDSGDSGPGFRAEYTTMLSSLAPGAPWDTAVEGPALPRSRSRSGGIF